MKIFSNIVAATIVAFSSNAIAEDFSIKGYALGQPMSACPANSVSNPGKVLLMCNLGPTTYAGAEASDHMVVIYNNEIISVMVQLKSRGRHANSGVLAAMKEKFGKPTESKSHLNSHIWRKGLQALSLDGYSGIILSANIEKNREASEIKAKANMDDL